MNLGCCSEFQTEIHSLWHNTWNVHSASSDQHEEMMSLRECLHVTMQCYMRQHFADRCWQHEHPGGHASWREPTMRKFTKESTTYFVQWPVCRWNIQKMQSESSEYVRKTTGLFTDSWRIKIALESFFEEHAQESLGEKLDESWDADYVVERVPSQIDRNISEGTSWAIQREWSVECSWGNCSSSTRKSPWARSNLERGGRFLDGVNGRYLAEHLVLAARREEIDWGTFRRCVWDCSNARMQGCRHEPVGLDLGRHRQVRESSIQEKTIEVVCKRIFKRRSKLRFKELYPLLNCSLQCHLFGCRWGLSKVESQRHQQSTFPRNQTYGEDNVGRLVKSMELKTLLTSGNLTTWPWSVDS